jgi:chromosome segregation ATPase
LQSIIDEQDTEHEDVSDDLRRVREEYDAVRHERDDLREACETMRKERDKAIRWHDKNVAQHNTMQRERDDALAHVKRLQEINERLETRNREATQAGASFGVETCGLLAEKDAEIARLRIECDRAIADRDKAVTELEDMRERERIARADAVHCHQEMRTLRTDLASTRAAHAEITAAHAKLAADVAHKDRLMRDMNSALTHAREEAKAAHDALTAEQGRTERLRAVMVDLIADLNAAKEGGE